MDEGAGSGRCRVAASAKSKSKSSNSLKASAMMVGIVEPFVRSSGSASEGTKVA